MIPEDILAALSTFLLGAFGVLIAALAYVGLRYLGEAVARKRARLIWPPGWRDKDRNEPESYGDQGGLPMPAAPGDEFYYAKRRAGD